MEWYNWTNYLDVLRFCLEILVLLSWISQVVNLVQDFVAYRKQNSDLKFRELYKGFTSQETYSTIASIQILAFVAIFG